MLKSGSSTSTASFFDTAVDVDYRLPLEFKAGLAWVGPRAQVEFDVLTYAAGGHYSAYSTAQTWILVTDPGQDVPARTDSAGRRRSPG